MRTKFSGILTLLMAFTVQLTFAQQTISGTVTDDQNLPLPGVNIVIKGTTTGTQSDFDGNYTINANAGQTLVFTYVGFATQERSVTASTTRVDLQMQAGEELTQVIVTGYGIKREKKALGYAVSSVSSEQIENKPESDLVRSLSGKVSGVQITGTGGATGSGTNFIIRSKSSINGSNQPLFIVDGVPFDSGTNQQTGFGGGNTVVSSRFLDLDPNNIESVDVLKGLSAAVLYGQQGRNGVVLITTKTGSTKDINKKFEVSLSQSTYVTEISNLADYQNVYGQGSDNFLNPGFVGNWGSRFDEGLEIDHPLSNLWGSVFPEFDGLQIPYEARPNNVEDFFRSGVGHATSINVSGSTDPNTKYNLNFGYTNEEGYIPGNDLTRYNLGVGGSTKLSNKFTFDGNLNFSRLEVRTPPIAANNAGGAVSIFTRLLFIPRNIDLINLPFENPQNGESVYYRSDQENPLWLVKYAGTSQKTNRVFGKLAFNYDISDKLALNYRFGLDTYTEIQDFFINKGGVTEPFTDGFRRTTSGTNFIFDHNVNLSINNINISDDISFTTQIGFNARRDTYDQFGIVSQNQIVFGVTRHNNFLTSTNNDPSVGGRNLNFEFTQNVFGVYGESTFDYKNFLFLSVMGRNDWASTLEKDNRALFYPGASISFIPTSVEGIGSSDAVNYFKIRAGYGTSARFPGPFTTRDVLLTSPVAFTALGDTPVTTNALSGNRANPELEPELQQEIEAGIEANFFNRRLSIDLTVYKRIIEDQILGGSLPPSTGFSSTTLNIGEIETEGIEIGLNFTPLKSADFSWDVINNFTAYETEVTELEEPVVFAGFTNLGNFAIEGEALGVIQGSYALRDENGNLLINPTNGKIFDSTEIEETEDGRFADLGIIGDPNPDWTISTINTFKYKGFTLSAQLEYQHGGDIFSQTATQFLRRGVTKANVDREGSFIIPGVLADPTTGEVLLDGQGNPIENTIQLNGNDVYFINLVDPSGQGVYDASHLRLREVSLGYEIPSKFLDRSPFGSVNFTLSGQNLYVKAFNFPDAFNFDPEALSTGVGNGSGLEFQTGPTSKRYSFSIKATF